MLEIKEYLCNSTPSDAEIVGGLGISTANNCVVKLVWFIPYNGWHHLYIKPDMTFEDCKANIPTCYGV